MNPSAARWEAPKTPRDRRGSSFPHARATELEPHRAQYLRALALVLFHGGDPEEAMQALEMALRLGPESQAGQLMVKELRKR